MKRMIGKHVLVGLSNRLCENAKTYENWGGQSFDKHSSVHKTEDLSAYLPLHLLTSGGHIALGFKLQFQCKINGMLHFDQAIVRKSRNQRSNFVFLYGLNMVEINCTFSWQAIVLI